MKYGADLARLGILLAWRVHRTERERPLSPADETRLVDEFLAAYTLTPEERESALTAYGLRRRSQGRAGAL
jgi:hypothetical protein